MDKRPLIGLAGVIVTALATQLNDQVSSLALPDIQGGLGMSHDPASWFSSLYASAACFGIAISPWWAVTLSFRRWIFGIIALMAFATVLVPFAPNLSILYGLRILQGLAGGAIIPMLMTVALRVLPPAIRLWGLIPYALTATVFPNLSAPVAALWTDLVGWRFIFFEAVPLGALAAVLVWHGMPVEAPHYERLKKIDWRGMLLALLGTSALTTMLLQGDRLDWWNSPLICVLALVAGVSLPLLLLNEWFQEVPLFKPQLLSRRNLAYGGITLFCFIVINLSSSTLPFSYLEEVQQFRPEQIYELTGLIALLQFLFLPMAAWLLNFEWIDARWLNFIGFSAILAACVGDSLLTSTWDATQFVVWQICQALGDALVVMPLLMMATNSIKPAEGPYGSSLFNTPRGIAEAMGPWLLALMMRWRGGLHSTRIAEQMGLDRFRLIQAQTVNPHYVPPLLPDGMARAGGGMQVLSAAFSAQTRVLVFGDLFLVVGGIVVFLMILLLILPERSYPPRIALASK